MSSWLVAALAAMVIGGAWRVLMKLCVAKTGWATTNLMLMAAEVMSTLVIVLYFVGKGAQDVKVSWPWWGIAGLAGVMGAANGLLVTWALEHGPVGKVSMIHGSAPVVALLLGALFLRERVSMETAAGMALVVMGLVLIAAQR